MSSAVSNSYSIAIKMGHTESNIATATRIVEQCLPRLISF